MKKVQYIPPTLGVFEIQYSNSLMLLSQQNIPGSVDDFGQPGGIISEIEVTGF